MLTVDLACFDAFALDLDGVVTHTASVHAAAWKRLFDELLAQLAAGNAYTPFDPDGDYRTYVDGKRRIDGLRSFLASRGISVPEGSVEDPPTTFSIHGLAARKDRFVREHVAEHGVEVYPDAIAFVRRARDQGVKIAVVSASENCNPMLVAARVDAMFPVVVDGLDIRRFGLQGKPAPDTFLVAARRLNTAPRRIVVVEDAIAGVEAGRAGGFGLIVGVDRSGSGAHLLDHGADVVVRSLDEIELRRKRENTVHA